MDATSIKYTLFVIMIDGWCYNVRKPSYVQYEILMMSKLLKIPQQVTLCSYSRI
uniref:Uncharacterized protein n=1 Tax=Rhizophagus irregularis (strain DAOM 181602 / DAOM 197198 / MUCL 43194) TaxID=747089 RepID=U9V5P2_RHIID